MNPTLHAQILTLRKYQAWRTGEDERTMDEAGIVPAAITSALDAVLEMADSHAKYLDLATELWAAAQLAPGEGVEDAENRMSRILEKALIPEGYALVPIEPTPEMLKSGWAENDMPLTLRWKAMINAAPKP